MTLLRAAIVGMGAIGISFLLWQRPAQLQVVSVPQLARVVADEFRDELALRARIEPVRSILLDAAEPGRVEAVFAQEGQWVEAGAPLYRLHSTEQEQLLMERSAEVAQQIANVSIQRSAQAASLAQSRRELAQLQAAQQETESEYQRINTLTREGFMSVAAREHAERQHSLAMQLLDQAREDHRIEARIRQQSLDEMARAVEGLQSGLQLLQQARERLTQHAPTAGRLNGFRLQVGESIRPGHRLGRIDDLSGGMQLVAEVDEYYLPRLESGLQAHSSAGNLQLVQTLPQVENGKVQVLLQWSADTLAPVNMHPGQTLEVRLQLSDASPALVLPDGPGVQSQLYVRDGTQLVRRDVRLGRRAAGRVEVLAGLQPGDEVLISQPPADVPRLALP